MAGRTSVFRRDGYAVCEFCEGARWPHGLSSRLITKCQLEQGDDVGLGRSLLVSSRNRTARGPSNRVADGTEGGGVDGP
jgi:hypothetical protein